MMSRVVRATLLPAGWPKSNGEGVVTITLASTTTLLHKVSTGREAVITQVRYMNRGASSPQIVIGDSSDGTAAGSFTARMVGLPTVAGQGDAYDAPTLKPHRFDATKNILCQLTAAGTVDIELTVEEF